jgi:sugar O-acyltransferase (sialic acid O-acetyltransferase NeuD family)
MKQLIIIGARGWGREVYAQAQCSHGYLEEYDIKGFLDDKSDALDGMDGYPPILGSVEGYEPQADDVFVCAMGDAHWKKHYAEIVLSKGGEFVNLINKDISIGLNTRLGNGCIICDNVGISCDITIGNFVTIQSYSIVGHDVTIGDYCHLGTRSFMGGFSSLGSISTIQTNSIILPHIQVGNESIVGAGAVVIRKVKDGTTVYGNPAKILKY